MSIPLPAPGRDMLPYAEGRLVAALVVAGTAGAAAVVGVAASKVDGRTFAVVLVALVAVVWSWRSARSVPVAVLAIAAVALLRRMTAGPSAYVLNDPLVLLPLLLLLPPILRNLPTVASSTQRYMTVLAVWLAAGGLLSSVSGYGSTALFGSATAIVPLVVGIHVAGLHYPGLGKSLVRVLPFIGAAVAVYGVVQRFTPARWDLAWLRTQQDLLTSVGVPVVGEFRVWGTAESPGSFASFLGICVLATVIPLLAGTRRRRPLAVVAAAVATLLCFVALAFTSVRTVLFALPFALTFGLLAERAVSRRVVAFIAGGAVLAALVLPAALSPSTGGDERYDLGALSQDQSFQDRSQLLEKFRLAVPGAPLGLGSGTSGIAARLNTGEAQQNVDNGYLARLIETGMVGLALFCLVVGSSFAAWSRRRRLGALGPFDSFWFAVVVYFLLLDLSGPTSNSLLAVFMWIGVGILAAPSPFSSPAAGQTAEDRAHEVVQV